MMLSGLALVTTLLAARGTAAVRRPDAEVPIERSSNQIIVRVSVGEKELRLGLDTGSDQVSLHPFAAKRAGLLDLPDDLISKVEYRLISDLRIGTLTFRRVPVHVRPLLVNAEGEALDPPEFDGLIGLDLLQKHAWGFDMLDWKLAIWNGGRVDAASVAAWTRSMGGLSRPVESRLLRTRGEPAHYAIERSAAEGGGRLVVDLGSPIMLLLANQAERYGASDLGKADVNVIGDTLNGRFAMGRNVRFAWRTLPSPLIVLIDKENVAFNKGFAERRVEGLVGWEAFSYARSVFDFPRNRVSVAVDKRAAAFGDHIASFGLRILRQGDTYLALVRPESPAARAGLKMMDHVEEIDGVPAETVARTLASPDGWTPHAVLPVKIRRGTETLTLEIRRDGT